MIKVENIKFDSEPRELSALNPQPSTFFPRRLYQRQVLSRLDDSGLIALLWRRQGGKTSTLAEICLMKMLKNPGRLITFASVSILLGREIVFKESQVLMRALSHMRRQAQRSKCQLEILDRGTGTACPRSKERPSLPLNTQPSTLNQSLFSELFEAQRLEFRLYHSRSLYSRTQVIAPNPATARGWTGDVILDEIGFIEDLPSLWEAMEPIVSSDPDFRVVMATTFPENESHYAYDLLAPATPTQFPVDPRGNWYRSEAGILVHRCNIYDAAAAGVPIYDLETRRLITPEEHLAAAINKESWRRNYALEIPTCGTAALSIAALSRAQEAGMRKCLCQVIQSPADLDTALDFLREHLEGDPVGIGWDPATTEKQTSNPSALAVVEKSGQTFYARLVLVWKTADPRQSQDYLHYLIQVVHGKCKIRQISIDATNERYFATSMAEWLRPQFYVRLVIATETTKVPGEKNPIPMKAYLGHKLIEIIEDGRMPLPPERYLKDDFRLVKKNKGTFQNETSHHGMHGDTFDAVKLAYHAVTSDTHQIAWVA